MKKLFLPIIALFPFFQLFAQKQLVVDPNAEMRSISGSFNSINVSGGIDLYISQSDKESVAVSASEEKFKNAIKTEVKGNVLHISSSNDSWSMKGKKLKVYVSFTKLERLDASGACDVEVLDKLTSNSFELKLSGASHFEGGINVKTVSLALSGASGGTINGNAENANIICSGASDIDGYDLQVDYCSTTASGASDIKITVNKEIKAIASGASEIKFKGTGVLKDPESTGASSISKRG